MTSPNSEPAGQRLSASDRQLLDAYLIIGVPLDELPYTPKMDKLLALAHITPNEQQRHDTFLKLLRLRKAGLAPRLAGFGPIKGLPLLTDKESSDLSSLVIKYADSIGRRDRLPYTEAFERLYAEFASLTGRQFDRDELWKLILRRSKNPTQAAPPVAQPDSDDNDEELSAGSR